MKIVILEPLGVPVDFLKNAITQTIGSQHELCFYPDRKEDIPSLIQRCQQADIVVFSNIPYRKEVIEHCPHLKAICIAFTGMDHVDLDYCQQRQIRVMNCAGYSTVAVADLVFGLALTLARNIKSCDNACRNGLTKNGLIGYELEGKRFGIIGLGAIGQRVAKIANAFGCEVLAYTRTPKEVEGVVLTDLHTLMSQCDIVSLHIPLNDDTRGMIGDKELSWMKSDAILINTARGGVIKTDALVKALKEHRIAGAGIDVFDMEPPIPKNYELMQCNNAIFTPHVGFATQQAFEKRAYIIAQNLKEMVS